MNNEQLTQILQDAFPAAEVVVSGQVENLTSVSWMINLKENVRLHVSKRFMRL